MSANACRLGTKRMVGRPKASAISLPDSLIDVLKDNELRYFVSGFGRPESAYISGEGGSVFEVHYY